MTIADLSQYNPDTKSDLLYGDPEIFIAFDMAADNRLITALQARGLELATDADAMADLRRRVGITNDILLGLTVIDTSVAAEVMPDGIEFLNESPESLGFCFSAGYERDGRDVLEVFVVIDPSRYPTSDTSEPTDEQLEMVLELNHFLITQLLIGTDGDDSDDEPTDEEFEAIEERAAGLLEAMIDANTPPPLAVIMAPKDEA